MASGSLSGKDLSNKELSNIIDDEVNKTINYIVSNYGLLQHKETIREDVFKLIDKNYKKQRRRKVEIPENEKCQGRKGDGTQCTRRCKVNELYCGSHLKNLPFGYISDGQVLQQKVKGKRGRKKKNINNEAEANDKQYIKTWIDSKLGNKYLVDKNNYVYKNNLEQPELIGIKKDGKIEKISNLPSDLFV